MKGLQQFVDEAQAAVKLRGDVSVLLTGDREIRRWNRDFRGKNQATDVLSFPAAPMDGVPAAVAGDLAISVETADRQAKEQGHVLAEELKVLALHGLLHLAGYDHETDDGTMARVERRLRAKLGLKAGLTERTQAEPAEAKPVKKKAAAKKTLVGKAAGMRRPKP